MYGVEAGGKGVETGEHAAPLVLEFPVFCTAIVPTSCRTRTVKSCTPTRYQRALIIPA